MQMLKRGSKGEEVYLLQKAVSETLNKKVTLDGAFGANTESLLKEAQRKIGVGATGIYDEPTQAILGILIDQKYIRMRDIDGEAMKYGFDPAVIKAIREVETDPRYKMSGFLPSGKPIILYERHIFYRLYKNSHGEVAANRLVESQPNICYPNWTRDAYMGEEREYTRLKKAMNIHERTALESTSWGMFQVMGFNYKTAGYLDVRDMYDAMCESEYEHLKSMIRFAHNTASLKNAIVSLNFDAIAKYYNGASYAQNGYHTKLRKAYNNYKNV